MVHCKGLFLDVQKESVIWHQYLIDFLGYTNELAFKTGLGESCLLRNGHQISWKYKNVINISENNKILLKFQSSCENLRKEERKRDRKRKDHKNCARPKRDC